MASVLETALQTPAKRRRIDQSGELVPDPELWLEDGNVIITAIDEPASTSGESTTYGFKCHKSVLAKQSSVFQTLFAMPPSAAAADVYEGLPLVALTDRYADVKGLLHYVYEPG